MTSAPKNWIHKHVALQQRRQMGVRPVVLNFGGKLITRIVRYADDDWARLAEANPGATEIPCGTTGITLWRADAKAAA